MTRRSSGAAALLLAACCACAANEPDGARPAGAAQSASSTVWQLSPFALLVRGNFDGVMTAGEVGRHGNMGVGAADALDGEIAVVDGIFYQYMEGGRVVRPAPSLRIPFAIMTHWDRGDPVPVRPGQQYTAPQLPAIDSLLPTTNAFYALRMTGNFSVVRARTFKRQTKPYSRLSPAMEDTFTITNVRGTMVGFREPSYVDSLSVPNWHFHFVNADGTQGGHVRGFTAQNVVLEYSVRPNFTLYVPPGTAPATAPR